MLSVDVIRQSKLITVAAKSAKKKTSMLRRIKSFKLRKFCLILKLINDAPQKTLSLNLFWRSFIRDHLAVMLLTFKLYCTGLFDF